MTYKWTIISASTIYLEFKFERKKTWFRLFVFCLKRPKINSFVKKIKTGTFTFGTFKFIYNILFEAGQLSQLFDFQKSDAST